MFTSIIRKYVYKIEVSPKTQKKMKKKTSLHVSTLVHGPYFEIPAIELFGVALSCLCSVFDVPRRYGVNVWLCCVESPGGLCISIVQDSKLYSKFPCCFCAFLHSERESVVFCDFSPKFNRRFVGYFYPTNVIFCNTNNWFWGDLTDTSRLKQNHLSFVRCRQSSRKAF